MASHPECTTPARCSHRPYLWVRHASQAAAETSAGNIAAMHPELNVFVEVDPFVPSHPYTVRSIA